MRTVQAMTIAKVIIGIFTRQKSRALTKIFSFASTLRHIMPVNDALTDIPKAPKFTPSERLYTDPQNILSLTGVPLVICISCHACMTRDSRMHAPIFVPANYAELAVFVTSIYRACLRWTISPLESPCLRCTQQDRSCWPSGPSREQIQGSNPC